MMANNRQNNNTGTSSAYSTISTSEMVLTNSRSRRSASPTGSVASFNAAALILGNSRPTFARSRSCDLIINGTALQPSVHLPPPPHLRHKFTTLSALGTKPTTKPLPFSFSVSTVCEDGSCRRFLEKKQRYAKCYEETFENIVSQHARIAHNLDKLAVKVRKIFNSRNNAPSNNNRRLQQCKNSVDCGYHRNNNNNNYNPLNYTDDALLDDNPGWDLGELVKNADILSRNLDVSSRILNELLKARNETASFSTGKGAGGSTLLTRNSTRSPDVASFIVERSSEKVMSSNIDRVQRQQQMLESQLSTIKIIGAKLGAEREQLMLLRNLSLNQSLHQDNDEHEQESDDNDRDQKVEETIKTSQANENNGGEEVTKNDDEVEKIFG